MCGWEALAESLRTILVKLQHVKAPWLVGGSCGLLLQGVALSAAPRDLDLYVDAEGAQELHQALLDYSIDAQMEDRTPMYRSILSHYSIAGTIVELVGGFEVASKDSLYKVEAGFLSSDFSSRFHVSVEASSEDRQVTLYVMPLEHELIFNVLRHRPDRYEAIAAVMKTRQAKWSPTMDALMKRNTCSDSFIDELKMLLLS